MPRYGSRSRSRTSLNPDSAQDPGEKNDAEDEDHRRQIQPGSGGEYQLTDAIRLVIQGGGKVYGVRLREDERRYDVGNFDSYFQAFVEFALADDKCGPALREYLKSILQTGSELKGNIRTEV